MIPNTINSPFVLVIFGATGDLAKNKLIPSLFSLFQRKELPDEFFIVGFARRPFTNDEFADIFLPQLSPLLLGEGQGEVDFDDTQKNWKDFAKHLYYQQGNFDEEAGYVQLVDRLKAMDEKLGACIARIFYLATPPENYEIILQQLSVTKLSEGCGQGSNKWTRIAIEKPFGKDLQTARELDKKLGQTYEEKQIFRVDHYLGKETVQNLLIFRFANGIFEPTWNSEYIDHVQITWGEKKGIETRGKFFDGVGMLRDVGQNHLMQFIAAVAQGMPTSFSKEGVRDARARAIQAIECIDPEKVTTNVVRAQYNGYLEEKDVDGHSLTETFIAMKFFVNSPRFAGVPFYLRAGKELAENIAEITLVFKQTCHILFKEIGCPEEGNMLKIRIQPDEGITLRMIAKTPGPKLALSPVDMHFKYSESFGTQGIDAYEKILGDIITGDQMLFNRSDELEASWKFIENIITGWSSKGASNPEMYTYEKGSWGPKEADILLEKDGRKWIK